MVGSSFRGAAMLSIRFGARLNGAAPIDPEYRSTHNQSRLVLIYRGEPVVFLLPFIRGSRIAGPWSRPSPGGLANCLKLAEDRRQYGYSLSYVLPRHVRDPVRPQPDRVGRTANGRGGLSQQSS